MMSLLLTFFVLIVSFSSMQEVKFQQAAQSLKDKGMRLWALEGGSTSVPLPGAIKDIAGDPIVLVTGNEISGVDPGILDLCEKIIHIPMNGIKTSLNAAVAFGIAVYTLRFSSTMK
jgi:tRNA G18 (ribose-2'-O)-methylase SpoU